MKTINDSMRERFNKKGLGKTLESSLIISLITSYIHDVLKLECALHGTVKGDKIVIKIVETNNGAHERHTIFLARNEILTHLNQSLNERGYTMHFGKLLIK